MIAINGEKGEVIEHGDDLAAASTDSLIFGGAIMTRKVYIGEWATSDAERDIAPDDVMPHE